MSHFFRPVYSATEYKGKIADHAFELFLSIEYTVTKAYSPQANGFYEWFNKTMKQECFDTAMRKKIYTNLVDFQGNLDRWLHYYKHERPHSGKYCYGKTPIQTWEDSKKLVFEKNNQISYLKGVTDTLDSTDKYKG